MNTFKFRIIKESDKIKGIAVSNEKIHGGLFHELNKSCHEAIKRFNGEYNWCETFIRFEHDGIKYSQVKQKEGLICKGCAFYGNKCKHPYYTTKPYCSNKIYKIVK